MKEELRKYFLNKNLVKKDFKTMTACIAKFGLNWRSAKYGANDLACFKDLPKKYIQERDMTPRIFVEKEVILVDSKSKATHILKNDRGGIRCKKL